VWAIRYLLGNAVDSAIEVGEWDWAVEQMADRDFLFAEPAERLWFGTYMAVIKALRGEDVTVEAERLYTESRAFDDPQYRTYGPWSLVVASLLADDHEKVLSLVDEVLENGIAGTDAAIWGARSAIWRGDAVTARRMRDAFEIAPPGRRTDALRATMDAGIAALEGRSADARALYAGAARVWVELGSTFWLGMTDIDLVVTGAMEPDERDRSADEARQIFTQLRAKPLLDRLDAALDRAQAARPGLHQQARQSQELRQEA
jgi:hypothetical protein